MKEGEKRERKRRLLEVARRERWGRLEERGGIMFKRGGRLLADRIREWL